MASGLVSRAILYHNIRAVVRRGFRVCRRHPMCLGVEVALTGIQSVYIDRWLQRVWQHATMGRGWGVAVSDDLARRRGHYLPVGPVYGVCGLGSLVFIQTGGAGSTAIDIPQEWGIVGFVCAVLLSMLGLFTWWVRGARQDQREATRALINYMSDEAKATANVLSNMTIELKLDRGERQEFQVRLLDAIRHVCQYKDSEL